MDVHTFFQSLTKQKDLVKYLIVSMDDTYNADEISLNKTND